MPAARFCSGCGGPLNEESEVDVPAEPQRVPTSAVAAVVGVIGVGIIGGLIVLLVSSAGRVDGSAFEQPVGDGLSATFDGPVTVDCPDRVRASQGKVTDCEASLPSGRTATVFVTHVDDDGHFTYQLDGAAAQAEIREAIERDAAKSQAELERQLADLSGTQQ